MKKHKTSWTNQDINTLKMYYGKMDTKDLSDLLERTPHALNNQAEKLGLSARKRWTKEEEDLLTRTFHDKTCEEWCEYFNVSKRSFRCKVARLGLFEVKVEHTGDIKGEVWKPFRDSTYLVSNKGRVRNTKGNRLLSPSVTTAGYLKIRLSIKGKAYDFVCHRLVAEVFIPNPENKPFVNHINGNKMCNSVFNLEWVTPSENMQHWADNLR